MRKYFIFFILIIFCSTQPLIAQSKKSKSKKVSVARKQYTKTSKEKKITAKKAKKKSVKTKVVKTKKTAAIAPKFITVNGTQFFISNQPYTFLGTNFWSAMNLAADIQGGNKQRLIDELNTLQQLGINNLRIMALTEQPNTEPYRIAPANNNKAILNETLMRGLDLVLAEMKKRNMYAVLCLSNFWPWSGGLAQYQKWVGDIENIAYPMDTTASGNWDLYMKNTAQFYGSSKAVNMYLKAIEQVINRKNTITNTLYKNDATIMSWQLCNEPRGMNNVANYLKWIDTASSFIKSIDSNHLVSVGSEGLTSDSAYNGLPFIATHQFKNIDYTTAHLWIQNWGFYDPKRHAETYKKSIEFAEQYINKHIELAAQLNKPFVLEEFGIMKDNGRYEPNASNNNRNQYFDFIFNIIYKNSLLHKASGVNFWAWSGKGRPRQNEGWWHVGDDFTGDPPHELQGWYSVYDTDTSTLQLLKKYTALFNAIH